MTNYDSNLKTWGDVGQQYPDLYSYTKGVPPTDEWDDFFNYNVEKDIQHLISLTNERLDSSRGTTYPSSPTAGNLTWRSDNRRLAVYDETSSAFRELAYKNELDSHNHDGRYVNTDGGTMTGAITWEPGNRPVLQRDSEGESRNTNGLFEFHEIQAGQREGWFGWYENDGVAGIQFTNQLQDTNIMVGDIIRMGGSANVNGSLSEQGNRVATRAWTNANADVSNADHADNADTVGGLAPAEVNHFSTESNISVQAGQIAIADDTGKLYYEDGN